jgi:bifunctional UDP-N-acetylglucosamine pyrophosphorylase/glucosamine-1-phosphate N-acetyltransferase
MKLQALVLSAGKGTRLRSPRAKALHEVLGLPLLEHVLRAVQGAGADPITVVVGHQADAVRAAFAGRGLRFALQEPPLGTGHAVQVAREAFAASPDRPLLVVAGDVPLLRAETLSALAAERERRAGACCVLSMELREPGAYGRVLRDAQGGVRGIVEARDASPEELSGHEVNAGVYVFDVPALLAVLPLLQAHNAQGEYYLTDVVGLLARQGHTVVAHKVDDPDETLGVNTHAELALVGGHLRRRILEGWMAAGVAVEDPESTTVGPDVVLEAGVTLRPFTLLEGRSRLAAGAAVGPFARLVDAEIGPQARVLDHCLLTSCVVEAGASIGPFAHVRPETRIGEKARVGNFVELKKTSLGAGSKANHLAYLGDASIGPGVNVGAGTITCNYDGHAKHPTLIGAGSFVGSNSTLVAPLQIGEGAYVGAGSVITEDVPADALALGRARQAVRPDWARKRRETLPKKEH